MKYRYHTEKIKGFYKNNKRQKIADTQKIFMSEMFDTFINVTAVKLQTRKLGAHIVIKQTNKKEQNLYFTT